MGTSVLTSLSPSTFRWVLVMQSIRCCCDILCYRVMAKGRGCGGEKTLSELLRAHVAPQEVTPQEATPQEVTPQEATPQEATPQEVTPQEVTPQEVTPQEVTPQEVTPQEVTPFDSSLTLIREPTEGMKGATWNNTERLALSGGKDLSRSWS